MKSTGVRALLALLLLGLVVAEQALAAGQGTLRASAGDEQSVADFADGQTLLVFAHQDDDLLWMLPFWPAADRFLLAAYPAAPVFDQLVRSFPARLGYRQRWTSIWHPVDNDTWAEVYTDRCKRAQLVSLASVKAQLRPFLVAPIKRVVTHNNWGEYGHAQHRLVNMAVRQLAGEAGLDVWALGTRMPIGAAARAQYVDVAVELGLPTIDGYFDPDLFREVRAAYLAAHPVASTAEGTARFRRWSPSLWTWSAAPEAFPMGWRPFIKLVHKGRDLTTGNPVVAGLERDVPIFNDCPTAPVAP